MYLNFQKYFYIIQYRKMENVVLLEFLYVIEMT